MNASERLARRLCCRLLDEIRGGTITIVEPDRREHTHGDPTRFASRAPRGPILSARVLVHDVSAYPEVARHGAIGLGQAYIDGAISCESPDDLVTLLRLLVVNTAPLDRLSAIWTRLAEPVRSLIGVARATGRPGDPDVDRANIRAHYDLGNDFFSLFLDETMSYSCAYFEEPTVTLADAQRAKMDRLLDRLELKAGEHLLEIGTGWGGLAIYAAQRYHVRVTTTTISAAQFELASERVAAAGCSDVVTVLDRDYRELDGTYDKLVSVEMIEAVDFHEHHRFFETCARLLGPSGLAAMQAIVIDDGAFDRAKRREDFIKHFIFPGGCLPSVSALTSAAAAASDLSLIALEDLGVHYPETLRRWRDAFEKRRPELDELGLAPPFDRLFEMYLCYCEAGFIERQTSVVQLVLARRGWRPAQSLRRKA